ncbi:MAG TPA: HD domain-containing protein [Candidatus Cloacimonadota bacterium]|nr:HD domain-containing protein [Candidatus Cloacimonadota bacterium]HPT72190.1 HD domain-containing protein [Candidatus Cloacimonadota bacterium]
MNKNLFILDQLYDIIEIGQEISTILFSPEFQRLREVRLINTNSPTFQTLSEIRRYSHSIGVYHLAKELNSQFCTSSLRKSYSGFLIGALLHDLGTPPFGHLFEYLLASIKNWNHERILQDILQGTYGILKRWHQIYYSKPLKLYEILEKLHIEPQEIHSYVNGDNIICKLLSSSLDIDNIDNVYRMGWALNLVQSRNEPLRIVQSMRLTDNQIQIEESGINDIRKWITLREKIYSIISFEGITLSSQAMLTDAFITALVENQLSVDDWALTDESIIRKLFENENTKEIIYRLMTGDYYHLLYLGWFDAFDLSRPLTNPETRIAVIDELSTYLGFEVSMYVFYDKGTFTKRVEFPIFNSNNQLVRLSEESKSTIISIFGKRKNRITQETKNQINIYLEKYGLNQKNLKPIPKIEEIYGYKSQGEFSFTD